MYHVYRKFSSELNEIRGFKEAVQSGAWYNLSKVTKILQYIRLYIISQ